MINILESVKSHSSKRKYRPDGKRSSIAGNDIENINRRGGRSKSTARKKATPLGMKNLQKDISRNTAPHSNRPVSSDEANNTCSYNPEEASSLEQIPTFDNATIPSELDDAPTHSTKCTNSIRFNVKCEIDIEEHFTEASINVTLNIHKLD